MVARSILAPHCIPRQLCRPRIHCQLRGPLSAPWGSGLGAASSHQLCTQRDAYRNFHNPDRWPLCLLSIPRSEGVDARRNSCGHVFSIGTREEIATSSAESVQERSQGGAQLYANANKPTASSTTQLLSPQ